MDFRAGADIDLEMDKAGEAAGKKIERPLHALRGGRGTIGAMRDVLRRLASKVRRTGDGTGSRLRTLSPGRKTV